MALSLQGGSQTAQLLTNGQNGRLIQWGHFVFSTTDASGNLPVKMTRVEAIYALPIGAPATDEQLYINVTADGEGGFPVASDGTISLARTGASKTSALGYAYFVIGW